MRSVMSPVVLDCPVPSLAPTVVCKWLQACRTVLEDFTESLLFRLTGNSLLDSKMKDDFDWRLNEFSYEGEYFHSLPRRAWKRHSAMLLIAREQETQTDVVTTLKPVAKQNCCGAEERRCRVCEINSLPIWATNIADMGLIDSTPIDA